MLPPLASGGTPGAPRPLVTGHRGAAGLEPENTLRAFRRALALGVDAVECDVHRTRDGRVAVLHDPWLDRTTDGSGPVSARSAAELARLDAGMGEPVPLLDAVVAAVAGRAQLVVELKAAGVAGPALAVVRDAGQREATTFIAFDPSLLREVQALDPGVATGALFAAPQPGDLGRAAAAGCRWVDLGFAAASAPLVAEAHALGLRVRLWTPNSEDELRAALALAPDAITTDRPDRLLALLGRPAAP